MKVKKNRKIVTKQSQRKRKSLIITAEWFRSGGGMRKAAGHMFCQNDNDTSEQLVAFV